MTAYTLFLCLFCQVLVVAGNLLLKHAMAGIDGQDRSRLQTGSWLFAGIALFSLWFFLWLDLLSKYELSQLYAFEGLAPVCLMACAWLFLHEQISSGRALGILLVFVGVLLAAAPSAVADERL